MPNPSRSSTQTPVTTERVDELATSISASTEAVGSRTAATAQVPTCSKHFYTLHKLNPTPTTSILSDINLCSHIWSVCYLAQSIFEGMEPMAEPCNRRCPTNVLIPPGRQGRGRFGYAIGYAIPMGQKTPMRWDAITR